MKTNKIKAWLALHGLSQVEIGEKLGVRPTMVCGFIAGRNVSSRLYSYFVNDLGVPKGYFSKKYQENR